MSTHRRLTASERDQALSVVDILLQLIDGVSPRTVNHVRAARDSIKQSGVRDQQWLDRN
jgi:hypothetical protein